MRVAVLGAGPAGLFAAHAVAVTNNDVTIFSNNRKSYMRGAQYLHAPIPVLSGMPFPVSYELRGGVDGYREKIYKDPRTKVSVESLVGEHLAWDIREAYDNAWSMYEQDIIPMKITLDTLRNSRADTIYDMVVSSIPAKALCENQEHLFTSEFVWVTETYRGVKGNTVLCSGFADEPWYRTSSIHGWKNTEYPENKKPPLSSDKVHMVEKPLSTNCDCIEKALPEGTKFLQVGRYGTWKKGVLSHRAFYDVFAELDGVSRKETNQ